MSSIVRALALCALVAGCSAQPQPPPQPEVETVSEANGAGEFISAPVETAPR